VNTGDGAEIENQFTCISVYLFTFNFDYGQSIADRDCINLDGESYLHKLMSFFPFSTPVRRVEFL